MNTDKEPYSLSLVLFYAGTLLISLTTFRPVSSFFNGSDTIYILSMVLLFIRLLHEGKSPIEVFIHNNPFFKPLLFFLLGATLSLINSKDLSSAFTVIGKYIFLIGIWLPGGAYLLDSHKKIRWMLLVLIAAALVPLVPAIGDYYFETKMTVVANQILSLNLEYTEPHGGRFGSIMVHPNNFGFMLVVVFPISLWLVLYSKPKTIQIFGLLFLYLLLTGSLVTASRTAAIALTIQLIVFIGLMPEHTLKRRLGYLCCMAILVCTVVVIAVEAKPVIIVDRFIDMASHELGEFEPDSERIDYMVEAWRAIQRHPIAGVGVENTAANPRVLGVHNTIFRLWAGIGIFGLISICWIYLAAFFLALTNINNTKTAVQYRHLLVISFLVMVSLIGWFLVDMVQPQFYDRFKFVTLILLMSIANIIRANTNYHVSKGLV